MKPFSSNHNKTRSTFLIHVTKGSTENNLSFNPEFCLLWLFIAGYSYIVMHSFCLAAYRESQSNIPAAISILGLHQQLCSFVLITSIFTHTLEANPATTSQKF